MVVSSQARSVRASVARFTSILASSSPNHGEMLNEHCRVVDCIITLTGTNIRLKWHSILQVSPEAVSYVDATFRRPRAVTAALPDGIAWSFVAVLLVVSLGLTAAAATQRVQPATPYWRSDPAHDLFVGSWALLVFAAAAQLAFAVWRQWRWRESGAPSNPLYALLVVAAVLLGAAVAVTAFAWPYSAAANNQCIAPSVDSFLSGNVFVGGSNNGNGSSIGGIVDVGAAVGGSGCACAQFGWEVFTCGVSSPTDDTCADVCDGGADCWEGVCDPDFLAGYRTVASLAAVWLALVLALGTAAAGGPLSGFLYPDSLDDELAMECELVLRGARRDGLPLRFTVAASDGEAVMAEVCAVAQAAKARESRRASA